MRGSLLNPVQAAMHAAILSNADSIVTNKRIWQESKVKETARSLQANPEIQNKIIESDNPLSTAIVQESFGKRTVVITDQIDSLELENMVKRRLPVVILLLSGNQTAIKYRDMGSLIFTPSSNQEIIDYTIKAFSICEDGKVLLPGIINIDRITIVEEVAVPAEKYVNRILPKDSISHIITKGLPHISYKDQIKISMENAVKNMAKIEESWNKKFNRSMKSIDYYGPGDAKIILILSGSDYMTAKAYLESVEEESKKIGLLKINMIRPWPAELLQQVIEPLKYKRFATIDQAISPGKTGILYNEIRSEHRIFCSSFLVNKLLNIMDFKDIVKTIENQEHEENLWVE